jgi:hypothetical protein
MLDKSPFTCALASVERLVVYKLEVSDNKVNKQVPKKET